MVTQRGVLQFAVWLSLTNKLGVDVLQHIQVLSEKSVEYALLLDELSS